MVTKKILNITFTFGLHHVLNTHLQVQLKVVDELREVLSTVAGISTHRRTAPVAT